MKYLCLVFLATSVAGQFTDDLYQLLAKENADKNLISSPLSVEISLAMVYMAAGGNTAQEMRKVLKLSENKQEVAAKYKEFLTNLKGREKVAILDLANRIYVNDEYKLNPEYNQVVKDSFKAEAEAISLKDADRATSIINKWVNDQTRGRIQDIVTKNDMTDQTLIAVLLNAIYFKGQWQYEFNPKNTKNVDFKTASQERVPVQMMSLSGTFKAAYVPELDAKVIELPYRNSSLSMVIFLPEKVDGLQELEKKIPGFSQPLRELDVNLKLPKFKIEFSTSLTKVLQTLGIRQAFTHGADLKGLITSKEGYISKILQKAFIEVNEEGAEAAAITAVSIGLRCIRCTPPPRLDFNADHPFAYVIRDQNAVYFQGHFVKPGQ
ncbi:serine protease inhibitor 42Dd [Drosophila eugracilis]|uniref:serine protease inhibitor 42Dd n=1 Tax=Drosophila eugracilis TaxID=29029 RepID=UPI001BDB1117|nr:serine protease inhibitor 42Dd [Drosophila eugracilis]